MNYKLSNNSKNTTYFIIVIILIIVFFILFFYAMLYNNNNLVKFRVVKEPIEKVPSGEIDYDKLKNKYTFKKCNDMCNQKICNEYEVQMIKYNLCNECKKKNKCYDPYKGLCVKCNNNKYNCNQLFGCDDKPPVNPYKNYCIKCWNQY
jgi:hypothetical protein